MSSSVVPARRFAAVFALLTAVLASMVLSAAPAGATSTLGSRAVAIAAQQKGKPYQWGGAGPRSFDCSGLVQYVYGRLGHYLPHNAAMQYGSRYVTHVSSHSKQLGDLIFMRDSSGYIYHVGIYAGAGKWWVAPHTGTVVKLQTVYSTHYVVGRVK